MLTTDISTTIFVIVGMCLVFVFVLVFAFYSSKELDNDFREIASGLGGNFFDGKHSSEERLQFSQRYFDLPKKGDQPSSASMMEIPTATCGTLYFFYYYYYLRLLPVGKKPSLQYQTVVVFLTDAFEESQWVVVKRSWLSRLLRKFKKTDKSEAATKIGNEIANSKNLVVEVSREGLLVYWPNHLVVPTEAQTHLEFVEKLALVLISESYAGSNNN